MHKIMIKFFGGLKSTARFVHVLIMFMVLLLLLYWIQDLTKAQWSWIDFATTPIEFVLGLGSLIYDKSIDLGDFIFEFKYPMALLILLGLYLVFNYVFLAIEWLEDMYGEGRKMIKRFEEKSLNEFLQKVQTSEQQKLKYYKIYIGTQIKNRFLGRQNTPSIDELNMEMNKVLIDRTGVAPGRYQEGFLYSFSDFDSVDNVLKEFFRLLKSESKLDYTICVQVFGANATQEEAQLKELISLRFVDKITMLADTSFRYKYNKSNYYGTSQVGIFQKESETFEVHEFYELI